MYLNFKKEHMEELQLDTYKFVILTKRGIRYTAKFLEKKTPRTLTLSKNPSGGARLAVPPWIFGLENVSDCVEANTFDAEYLDDRTGLQFDFDAEEFLKPKEKAPIATIATREDKIEAGFKPDSAWGVKFQSEIDAKIQARINAYMKSKFGLDDDA